MRRFFVFTIFLLLFSAAGTVHISEAQVRYIDHSTVEGVDIQYRWVHSTWIDRSSPLELRLKIKNNNDYPVEVSYVIEFFMGPMLEERSDTTRLCINRKLAKTGRINGMYYQSNKLTNEEIESDEFIWEINDLNIKQVASCP
ncbi:MAG: hypothetical protein R6U58_08515 [Bacteroidales bacterium]